MSAEAQAWSEAPCEVDRGHVGDAASGVPRRAVRSAPRRPQGPQPERGQSWNVLTEELVSFPRPGRHATLEELTGVRPRGERALDPRQDAARARRYGEAWLERELVAVRYMADAGYPALRRRAAAGSPSAGARALRSAAEAGRCLTDGSTALALPLPLPVELLPEPGHVLRPQRRVQHSRALSPARREDDARVAARARGRAVAVKPRGLRRLLPGVATLAALAGIWAGAGMLSSSQARPLAVLPGSVKVPGGYSYVVRPGDTLWSIATRLDPGGDPRALVTELSAQVPGGTLQPGSRLRLP
ncbi:MAG: LysM peptidoglycan-binding domain-containing protein [Acidimicrobiales bacterium]